MITLQFLIRNSTGSWHTLALATALKYFFMRIASQTLAYNGEDLVFWLSYWFSTTQSHDCSHMRSIIAEYATKACLAIMVLRALNVKQSQAMIIKLTIKWVSKGYTFWGTKLLC